MVYLVAVVLLMALCALLWEKMVKYWHVGFGVMLVRKVSDGTVWVASRLVGYPAHNAGITHPCRLVSVNDKVMVFERHKDFVAWFKSSKPRRNQEETWVVETPTGFHQVKMKPVWVTTSIPVRWSPNHALLRRGQTIEVKKDSRMETWPVFCEKTGDIIRVEGRLKREVVHQAYFDT